MLLNYLIPLLINLIYFIRSSYSISYESVNELCDKKANCVVLNSSKCLDITLSYKYSKLNGLLQDFNFNNEQEIHDYLDKWTGLKSVPRCWTSLQPLLCTAFFPKCSDEKIPLLPLQTCRNVRINCRILDQFISLNNIQKVPSFLKCNDTNFYQPRCKNDTYTDKDIKFNSSVARCQYPLVSTDNSIVYYKNIEGCALDCDDPLYHKIDKQAFQNFIVWSSFLSLIISLMSVVSYFPNWSSLNLTAKITFYIQVCFIVHYLGWLMQSFMNKKQIVCRSDQTLRYSQPNTSDPETNGLFNPCLVNFILIYYSSFSILTWYAIMAITLKFLDKNFKLDKNKNSILLYYYHLCPWFLSFIFTILAIWLSQIEGNYVYGICFVGLSNKLSRFLFILLPLTVGSLIIMYGMIKKAAEINLRVKELTTLNDLLERNEYKRRYKKFVFCSLIVLFITIFSYIFQSINDLNERLEMLNNEILCQLNLNSVFGIKNDYYHSNCFKNFKKNLTLDYWIISFIFGSGILSSLWNLNFVSMISCYLKLKKKI